MMLAKDELGQKGEAAAKKYLKRQGYRILEQNLKNAFGEVDLVAMESGELVFVEVKTRTDSSLGAPEEAVTPSKRAHIVRTALGYVQQTGAEELQMRFDVVGVTFDDTGKPQVNLIKAAFTADDAGWAG